MPADPSPLIAYLRDEISIDDLPSQLYLPEDLWQQMDDLWQRSIAELCENFRLAFFTGLAGQSLEEVYTMTQRVFVKDDTELVAAVGRARREAQTLGLPEPKNTSPTARNWVG